LVVDVTLLAAKNTGMTGLTIPFVGLKKQYHNLRQEILDATDEVLRSGQLMNGNNTIEFENWLAKKNNCKYAITCHSGTAALEIIASYLANEVGMPNPPRAVMPSFTFPATANAFMRAGWDILFADTDHHGILDTDSIPHDASYQAVVLVGLYGASVTHLGRPKHWDRWRKGNCTIVEDAAQHWLSAECTRLSGHAALSFDPMKNLPCYGNGGAVVTNDSNLLHYAQAWRDNGKADHVFTGTNNRMSELDCALMMVKTKHIAAWQKRRADIANYWRERLAGNDFRCLIDDENAHDHSFHKFVIDSNMRDELQKKLALRKIETRIHYANPLHEIGIFRQWPGPSILGSASALARRVLSLPLYPELTDLEVDYIADQLLDCIKI